MSSHAPFTAFTKPTAVNTAAQKHPPVSPTTLQNASPTLKKRKAEAPGSVDPNDRAPLEHLDGNRQRKKKMPNHNGAPSKNLPASSNDPTDQVPNADQSGADSVTFKRGKKFLLPGSNGGPKVYMSWEKKNMAKDLQAAIQRRGFLASFVAGQNMKEIPKREMIEAFMEWDMNKLSTELKLELESRGYAFEGCMSPEEVVALFRKVEHHMEKWGVQYSPALTEFDFEAANEKYRAMDYLQLLYYVEEMWDHALQQFPGREWLIARAVTDEWAELIPDTNPAKA
ncbi:uncharacterized protein BDZ99DRAFT_526363 [Mytilinidion resinicola]|uniref:Uncharacterized protein n=1 Tax=Mytilinidion resinicola TaxID=574789 RepID=A0A6A6Y6S5_9PEZI|nr:uncharacterized protein BDZ99DRAFT_526363 [Mytilinidion resinicola]KAF2803895.1 hypothetical protein BDZ99DRAFT_526363 [Mytilinidion resinicola]